MDNSFLKHLDTSQVREMVDAMYAKEFSAGALVVKEGETGIHLYVSGEGDFEIIKDGKVLGLMGPGKAFGELAILYNCTRTASIRGKYFILFKTGWLVKFKFSQYLHKFNELFICTSWIIFCKTYDLQSLQYAIL